MPRTRPPYPPEFKAEAVTLARSSEKPLSELARDLGVSTETLRNWTKQQQVDTGQRNGITTDEREELRRLRKENKASERNVRSSGKLRLFRQRGEQHPEAAVIFSFIEIEKVNHSIVLMCRVLRVSRSGFYAWRVRAPSIGSVRMPPLPSGGIVK